jgi:hypothetical protein
MDEFQISALLGAFGYGFCVTALMGLAFIVILLAVGWLEDHWWKHHGDRDRV